MHNNQNFSSCKRDAFIEDLTKKKYDVLIFGGGITGAGIALDAASRGLTVALIEKSDYASGTSSRSTKLIHGGLRYLQQMQFKFVAQLGKERKIIHANAQNNVIPTPVLLPIYKGGKLKKGLSFLALFIYDILACVNKEHKTKWINKKKLLAKYNFLEEKNLHGALIYYEYKTNDGRLVIETIKKAVDYGAYCLNYVEPLELLYVNGQVKGSKVRNNITGEYFKVEANTVVNATGVWCKGLMKLFGLKLPKDVYATKGVHLVFTKERFPIKDAFYFDTHDERMIFAIPRQNNVYVGTTDTPYNSDFQNPVVEKEDIKYLLKAMEIKFPNLTLGENDIVSCWAGIRPLLKGKRNTTGEISRKEEIFYHENGLITITGGKLTGYRLMAKKVVDSIVKSRNLEKFKCKTSSINLSGAEFTKILGSVKLVELADHAFDEAKQTGISIDEFKVLYYRYGTNIGKITEKAYELMSEEREPEKLWLMAELWYAINFEMLTNLCDFFIYRTEMVLFEHQKVERVKLMALNFIGETLQWSTKKKEDELIKFEKQWKNYQR